MFDAPEKNLCSFSIWLEDGLEVTIGELLMSKEMHVLILIWLEDGLEASIILTGIPKYVVLILIWLEDGLEGYKQSSCKIH